MNERGNTPLHDAARWNCIGIVHLLLENDAPLNIKNVQGLTPLQMAKVCGDGERFKRERVIDRAQGEREVDNVMFFFQIFICWCLLFVSCIFF